MTGHLSTTRRFLCDRKIPTSLVYRLTLVQGSGCSSGSPVHVLTPEIFIVCLVSIVELNGLKFMKSNPIHNHSIFLMFAMV